jgi:DNA polymerase alpha subunit B
MNPTGRKLVAERICEGAAHKASTSSIRELRESCQRQQGLPLRIMSVCGPYTTSDNLDYEPFLDLMNKIMEESPDVVLLTGPFVDLRQDAVKKGETKVGFEDGEEMTVPYEPFFANKIASLIEELYMTDEQVHTQFVLVPSLDDATADWV